VNQLNVTIGERSTEMNTSLGTRNVIRLCNYFLEEHPHFFDERIVTL